MNKVIKSKIIDSLKESYSFLEKEYDYSVIDEESSSSLFFYIRYENKAIERIISVSIDLREADFGITIWKSSDGWTQDENMLEFESYLQDKDISVNLQSLTEGSIDTTTIEKINKDNASIFQNYGSDLILGENY